MNLAHFVYIINSFNPIDFEQNLTISEGKVAILSLSFAFFVYVIKAVSAVRFLLN